MSGPETKVSRDQQLEPGEVQPFEVEELS